MLESLPLEIYFNTLLDIPDVDTLDRIHCISSWWLYVRCAARFDLPWPLNPFPRAWRWTLGVFDRWSLPLFFFSNTLGCSQCSPFRASLDADLEIRGLSQLRHGSMSLPLPSRPLSSVQPRQVPSQSTTSPPFITYRILTFRNSTMPYYRSCRILRRASENSPIQPRSDPSAALVRQAHVTSADLRRHHSSIRHQHRRYVAATSSR